MAAVEAVFYRACEADFNGVRSDGHEEVDDGHGRHEERDVAVIYDPEGLPSGWPDAAAVVLVNRARDVGGDFYQIMPRPDRKVMAIVGDVSGKGLEAAMLAARF